MTDYDRELLRHTLIYHQRVNNKQCLCGYLHPLGARYTDHILDTYETAARCLPRPRAAGQRMTRAAVNTLAVVGATVLAWLAITWARVAAERRKHPARYTPFGY